MVVRSRFGRTIASFIAQTHEYLTPDQFMQKVRPHDHDHNLVTALANYRMVETISMRSSSSKFSSFFYFLLYM